MKIKRYDKIFYFLLFRGDASAAPSHQQPQLFCQWCGSKWWTRSLDEKNCESLNCESFNFFLLFQRLNN